MAGNLPASGTTITMGRTRNAYNLSGTITLRAGLGAQKQYPGADTTSAPWLFSNQMGGQYYPGTY
jgi:hypothetical protein